MIVPFFFDTGGRGIQTKHRARFHRLLHCGRALPTRQTLQGMSLSSWASNEARRQEYSAHVDVEALGNLHEV